MRRSFFKIKWLVQNWIADFVHFWRHGLKHPLRSVIGFFKFHRDQLQDWWKTRDSRRKFAKIERKHQAGRLREGAAYGLKDFGESIWSQITSPKKLVRWSWMKFQELRKMSFREACEEIWMGYLGLVAALLNRIEYTFHRLLESALWLRAFVVVTVISVVIGVVSLPWVIKFAKQERSDYMLAEAKTMEADGRMVEAYQKSRAAALLRLDNLEASEFVLKLAEDVRTPEAVWWAERVAKANGNESESLAKVIQLAAYYRQPKVGVQYLAMLKDKYPEDEAITDAELQLLLSQGKRVEAITLARQAYKAGKVSPVIHEVLAQFYLNANDPINQNALTDYLRQNLYRNDEVGLALKRLVLTQTEALSTESLEEVDFMRILADLRQNPDAKPTDCVLAYGRALKSGLITPEHAQVGFLEEYDIEDSGDRQDAIEMASIFGLYGMIDAMPTTKDKDLAGLRMEALILGPAPDLDGAEQLLEAAKAIGLTPLQESFWRAMLARERGDKETFSNHLQQALEYAELDDWIKLENMMHRVANKPQLLEFYRESLRRWPSNEYIAGHSINYAYSVGAEVELNAMTQQLPLETFKRDPFNRLFLIYLNALDERDLPTGRYLAEDLVAKYPREASYYIGLAFVYAQSKNVPLAQSLLKSFPLGKDYDNMPPFMRICLAASGIPDALPGPESLPLPKERALLERLTNAAPGGA